jgi:hypothetical protein
LFGLWQPRITTEVEDEFGTITVIMALSILGFNGGMRGATKMRRRLTADVKDMRVIKIEKPGFDAGLAVQHVT